MAISAAGRAVSAIQRVMIHGDEKYGENQWTRNPATPAEVMKHLAGAIRHLGRYLGGDTIDESGEPALAHVGARVIMALETYLRMDK